MEKPVPKILKHLQDMKKTGKGERVYSTLSKFNLQLLLAGKPVSKKMKKNHISVESQTDFRPCDDCGLGALMTHLCFKADMTIVYDGDMEIDAASGKIVG